MKFYLGMIAMLAMATPALAADVWSEDFGNPGGNRQVAAYDGWKNAATCTYEATGFNPDPPPGAEKTNYLWDVRKTMPSGGYTGATGLGNMFKTTYKEANGEWDTDNFFIKGIDISAAAAADRKLRFGLWQNTGDVDPTLLLKVFYSTDSGSNWTQISYTVPDFSASWRWAESTDTLPASSALWLKFVLQGDSNVTESNVQFRIDDVTIGSPITAPTIENATIAQVIAAEDGTICTNVVGVVTSVGGSNNRKQFTIQADGVALFVDNGNQTHAVVGDEVKVLEGNKATYANYGIVQLQPTDQDNGIVQVTPNKGVPAPVDYTVAEFNAKPIADFQSSYIRVTNVVLTGPLPAKAGETTWLSDSQTMGSCKYTLADASDPSMTCALYLPSDLGIVGSTPSLDVWKTKVRPVLDGDVFHVTGVVCAYQGANQIYVDTPCGTAATFDGPFTLVRKAAVDDWSRF